MLTLICGLPRAGKTTYSQRFEGKCKVLHTDFCGFQAAKETARHTTEDIVVEGVYSTVRQRTHLAQAYKGNGKRCIWLDTPLEVRSKRPNFHMYSHMTFEPPTYSEGWDEIIIIGENNGESN